MHQCTCFPLSLAVSRFTGACARAHKYSVYFKHAGAVIKYWSVPNWHSYRMEISLWTVIFVIMRIILLRCSMEFVAKLARVAKRINNYINFGLRLKLRVWRYTTTAHILISRGLRVWWETSLWSPRLRTAEPERIRRVRAESSAVMHVEDRRG